VKVLSKARVIGSMVLILMVGVSQASETVERPAECADGNYRKQNYQACFGAPESNDAAQKGEQVKAEFCKRHLAVGLRLKTRIVELESVEESGRDEAWTEKYQSVSGEYKKAGVTFRQHCAQLEEYRNP
jgi:hypothetical protein